MESLYATIQVKSAINAINETVEYYITQEESFGLKIVKTVENNDAENDEIIMQNITKEKSLIEEVITLLIRCGDDFSQIQYIVEDFLEKSKK